MSKLTFKKVSNPLTIVAIFAALAEINGTVVISLVPLSLQSTFLWFIILLPSCLLLLFFLTLNFNPKVLYAPSDYTNEENFYKLLSSSKPVPPLEIKLTENKQIVEKRNVNQKLQEITTAASSKDHIGVEQKDQISKVNAFFDCFRDLMNKQDLSQHLTSLSLGIHAKEYYLFKLGLSNKGTTSRTVSELDIIIRVTTDENNNILMIALGKDIITPDPYEFASKVVDLTRSYIENIESHRQRFPTKEARK